MEQNKEVKQNELQEALRLLYANVVTSSIVSAFVSTTFIFSFNTDDQDYYYSKMIWWLIMMAGLLLRLLDVVFYRKKASLQYTSSRKDLWRFSLQSLLIASIWGVYPLCFFPFPDTVELTATTIIICGIASGVANMWSAHKFTAVSCVILMSGPLSILLLLSEDSYHHLLGTMGLAYTVVMSLSAIKFSSFTYNTIRLKNQNTQLLQHMEKKIEVRTQRIYRLSNIDRLTGLLNRTAFLKELNQIIDANPEAPFALLFIDLDGFKQINDSLGHQVGDKVVKETASRIALLSKDNMPICRWGGDEFLVAYRFESIEDVNHFSQKLIHTIGLPHSITKSKTWIGATIGVALYPEHGNHHDTLIQNADMAMYQQKRLEKGQVGHFNESLRLKSIRAHLLTDRLSTAIEKNELRLVFQPIIKSKTGNLACIEALLRWNLDNEEISPIEFIPIAEQYGMIKSIGLWVAEKACQQIITLSQNGRPLTISINVSIIQLQDRDFVTYIRTLLTQLEFEPSLLHIEITESVFAADKTVLMKQIKALQEMGIKISIDDFGTGYSSLASMQDLGVDIVKIDKSFIDKINDSDSNIVHAVMQISQSMGYKVVAEGVESIEQVEKLNEIGVHFLQGYYFSKPLEVNQLTNYINSHL